MSIRAGLPGVFASACFACLIVGGCGAPEREPASTSDLGARAAPATSGADTGGSAGSQGRSACDLVSADEASAIVGSAVVTTAGTSDPMSSSCAYALTANRSQGFVLKVQWTGGKSAWEVNRAAGALSGKLLGADRGSGAESVMKVEEVPLGDQSSYNPILGGYVLKGDVLLEFNNLLTLPNARTAWQRLAQTALAKL